MKTKGEQFKLYHGSSHWFKPGETVNPTDRLYTNEPHAYASESAEKAGMFASIRQNRPADMSRFAPDRPVQGTLFSPVFEVEHKAPPEKQRVVGKHAGNRSHSDPEGFEVKRLAGITDWQGKHQKL